jgi:RNA polymerase sigma-70 factor (ECF subfamily)
MTELDADAQTQRLLDEVRSGDGAAFDRLFALHRPALRRFVALRFDPHVRARLDPSDVVQETQMEAYRRMGDFLERQPMPFHVWLRKTAFDRLLKLRRTHVEAARRSVERELGWPDESSLLLARPFLDPGPAPDDRLARAELARQVNRALAELTETEREILLMRNVEEMPYREIGCILDLDPAAARKRYGRALLRLRAVLLDAGLIGGQS